nr:ATP-binding protein [Thiocapsa imhoffii]
MSYLPMNRQGLYNLFQLINGLYEYRWVLLTTNKDFTNWGEFFCDENVAVPIVYHLIHHSHVFLKSTPCCVFRVPHRVGDHSQRSDQYSDGADTAHPFIH